jgi:hypothetical protein
VTTWQGFGTAKRLAVATARGPWILSVDADEVVTEELAEEIRGVTDKALDCVGFEFPRRTNFLGRWIRHCGWYPDYQLRLFKKEAGNFTDAVVHERVVLEGRVGRLRGDLLHYSDPNLEHYLEKFNRYTTLGAQTAYRQGKRARLSDLVLRPPVSLFAHYVSRQGFRDGLEGFILSVLSALAVFVKYAKLRHLARTSREDS